MFLRLFVLLFVLLFGFSGCSKTSKTAIDVKQLTYTFWGDSEEIAVVDKYVRKFEKENPDIKIKKIHIAGQNYSEKLLTMFAGNEGPDVLYIPPAGLKNYVEKGILQELDEYIKKDHEFDKDDFLPGVFEPYRHKGKLYGVPRADQTLVIFYNKDVFKKAGVEIPDDKKWTWDDFLEISLKIMEKSKGKTVPDYFAYAIPMTWWGFYLSIWAKGGEVFTPDLKKCVVDSPENIKIIKWWADYVRKYNASPVLVASEGGTHEVFFTGKVAMYPMGMWVVAQFNKLIKNFEWDAMCFPLNEKGKRPTLAFYAGWGINAKSRYPEESWKFLKFISGKESQKIIAQSMHDVPPLKSIAYSKTFLTPDIPPANDMAFLEMMRDRRHMPQHSSLEEINNNIFQKGWQEIFVSKRSVEEICKEMASAANKILSGK